MINKISEGPLRVAAKVDPGGSIHEQEVNQQRAEEVRQARPVEKSESGNRTKEKKAKGEGSSRYVVDDNKIIYEKYDQTGALVYRLPPSYRPVDERI